MTLSLRYRYPTLLSLLLHSLVLFGGVSMLYEEAEYGVAPGGGEINAQLMSWEQVQEDMEMFAMSVPDPAPEQFVVKKEKPKPQPVAQAKGDSKVEGSPGEGEGYGQPTTQPVYYRNPLPSYPRDLRSKGIEGTVLLAVRLDKAGRVHNVEVLQSSGHAAFDHSAVETIQKRWRFRPARIGLLKVESTVRVPIVFEIAR